MPAGNNGHGSAADVSDYGADKIKVLEGLEAVRKRPAMYIGSTGPAGLHHLVYEVVDNSIDEALAGFCNEVNVTIHIDGSVTVVDNGRGIPVDHARERQVGRRSRDDGAARRRQVRQDSYKVSGGLHGVGVSVVNALSESWSSRSGATARSTSRTTSAARRSADLEMTGTTKRAARRSPSSRTRRSSKRPSSASTRWRSGCASSPS